MSDSMLAFFNDNSLKQEYINRVRLHEINDEIIQGTYWENGRGCSLGCTVHEKGAPKRYNTIHDAFESKLNMPAWLAEAEECIFERATPHYAKTFPLRFLNSIPVGFTDWRSFYDELAIHLYEDVSNPMSFSNEVYHVLIKTINYHRSLPTDMDALKKMHNHIRLSDMNYDYYMNSALYASLFSENLASMISATLHLKNMMNEKPSYSHHPLFEDLGDYIIDWFNGQKISKNVCEPLLNPLVRASGGKV